MGRRFRTTRRVRLADAGLDPGAPWVARRTVVWSPAWPRLGDRLAVTTFCDGLGSRWGERRPSLRTQEGAGRVEVASLWVFLGEDGQRPTHLPDWFVDTYGDAALEPTDDVALVSASEPGGGFRL